MLHRRQFLQTSAVVAATAAVARPAAAIPPIQRNGQPNFKFSLAAYSYRDLLLSKQGKEPLLTLHDFIDDCAKMNLEGTELTSYYFPKEVTKDYLHGLRQHAFRLGLDISGTAIGNEFGHPNGEKRDAEIAKTKQWIEHAAVLSAPAIRIFAGHQQKGQTEEEAHKLMVSAIEECCDSAGKFGVYLALENHGGPTSTAAGLLKFVHDVNSPWFGVNLDGGNFRGDDPYAELAQIAPYAVNAQIKAKVGGKPADFKRLAKVMRDANYRGYIVLEYEEPGNVREECPRIMNEIRAAFA
ncbi:MAG TPA: sugar phosphate isomerase/epimerase family protein [Pirellulaceae bacterium]|jgi:sugar phosphate isomerase/epimerase